MSHIIDFLERIGSEAQWRTVSQDELELALAEAGIEPTASSAILAGDVSELQALLQKTTFIGVQVPPMPVPPDEDEDEEQEEGDEEPTKDIHRSTGGITSTASF